MMNSADLTAENYCATQQSSAGLSINNYVVPAPFFRSPYVDADEERSAPSARRYILGGFSNTDTRFAFCFPPVAEPDHDIRPIATITVNDAARADVPGANGNGQSRSVHTF